MFSITRHIEHVENQAGKQQQLAEQHNAKIVALQAEPGKVDAACRFFAEASGVAPCAACGLELAFLLVNPCGCLACPECARPERRHGSATAELGSCHPYVFCPDPCKRFVLEGIVAKS